MNSLLKLTLGSRPARACTLSSCAIPWSVSAAWNWTLLLRARANASCSVSVSGACVELCGCDSWAAMWTNGQINNSKNVVSVADFPADTGEPPASANKYTFHGLCTRHAAKFETLRQESVTLR